MMDKKLQDFFDNIFDRLMDSIDSETTGYITDMITSDSYVDEVEEEKPLPTPKEIYDHLKKHVIGQDRVKKELSVVIYNHYKKMVIFNSDSNMENKLDKSNMMMIGPSGSGKTHMIKTACEFMGVPYVCADANTLTASGYVGKDVETVIQDLMKEANNNVYLAEAGVVFIDEVDKITSSSVEGRSTKDVGGKSVQQALLKMIEGTKIEVDITAPSDPVGMQKKVKVDTSNILFLFAGAFVGIEKIVEKRLDENLSSKFGFIKPTTISEEESRKKLLEKVNTEDLEKYGLIPEFIGRIPIVSSLEELTEDHLIRILTEPENSITSQYKKMFEYDGLKLNYTKTGLREIARQAKKQKTGARALRQIMENVLMDNMFEMESVSVTEKLVKQKMK
jgi:ATP-dependent Clp protease ATP-binding subunit ClpX